MVARSTSSDTVRVRVALVVAIALFALAAGTLTAAGAAGLRLPLETVSRVALSGPAVRFDYTSLDPSTNLLWISHTA